MTTKTFLDFKLDPRLCEALAEDGITEPFPIQELTLPVAIDGHDVIGQARTGSGKTFGFGLPALHRVDESRNEVQVLVVTPTRELCLQVTDDFEQASRKTDIKLLSIYGGVPIEPQTDALKSGVHVIVGTPGRLLDHVRRGNLDLSTCQTLILDEADEMLDMGFLPDVEQLIAKCHEDRHTMLFSATMPTAVVNLARRYMDRPTFIRAEVEQHTVPDRMEQHFFLVHKLDKPRILARILQTPERGLAVVFTRTKAMADRLVDDLRSYEIDAIAIHGDLRQATREKNLDKFKSDAHRHDVLVATEVAARGLDIDELTHVVNYDPPEDEKMYLHRIGRTARAGQKGVAITFATFAEVDRVNAIRKTLDLATEPIEEVFSTSDVLKDLFDLPDETPWEHLGTTRSGSGSSRSKKDSSSEGGSEKDSANKGRPNRGSSKKGGSTKDGSKKDGPKSARSDDRRSTKDGAGDDRAETSRGGDSRAEKGGSQKKDSSRDSQPARAKGSDDANDVAEGIDGSTATRARTRTRSRGGSGSSSGNGSSSSSRSSSDRSSSDRSSSDRGSSEGGDAAKDSGSSSSSGRTRARARRSRPSDSSGSGSSSSSASSRTASSRDDSSSARGSSKGGSSRGGSSGRNDSSKGGSSRSRGSSGGGRNRGSSSNRSNNDEGGRSSSRSSSQRDTVIADPASVPTRPGDEARGDGDPGIVRQVKVEHLP